MSRLLFAVTREDHQPELALAQHHQMSHILCVCSGGCTPLSLKTILPQSQITIFDINPVQLQHIQKKIDAINDNQWEQLNIDTFNPKALNQCGEFESLFRIFRQAVVELVADKEELENFFHPQSQEKTTEKLLQKWLQQPYWLAPFQIAFNDPFLHMMFTERATQHAGPNSYIPYFQKKITAGLLRKNSHKNPFLQHIFLGYYHRENAPPYHNSTTKLTFESIHGSLPDVPDLSRFHLVSLSNIFDWSDMELVINWAQQLQQLPTGAAVLIRQLNNHRDWLPYFSSHFTEDPAFNLHWQQHERSLFYDHYRVFYRK